MVQWRSMKCTRGHIGLMVTVTLCSAVASTSISESQVVHLAFFTDLENVTELNATLFELNLVSALSNGGVPGDDVSDISVASIVHRDGSIMVHANVSLAEAAMSNMTMLGEDGVNVTYDEISMVGYSVSDVYMAFSISFEDINSTAFKIAILDALDTLGVPSTYVMSVTLFAGSVVAQTAVSAESGYANTVENVMISGGIVIEYNGNSYTASSTTTTYSTTATTTATSTGTTTPELSTVGPTMPSRDVPFASEGLELTKNKLLVAAAFAGAAGTLALLVLTVAQIRYTFYGYHSLKASATASRLHEDADEPNAPLLRPRADSVWSFSEPVDDAETKSGKYGSVIASTDIDTACMGKGALE